MTIIEHYTAKCHNCGHTELRPGVMSLNSAVDLPSDLIEEYPKGCPNCGDEAFDVHDDDSD